jgi:L-fucose isomerase-like protein
MKLALLVANRGFFPSSVIETAYSDMKRALAKVGVECLTIPPNLTKYNAVETTEEGIIFARFLEEHRGEYDGLIICLPNFGDENGIKAAIRDVNVPILIQAYPDELGKMDFEHRRDSFCGKLALTSVLTQMGVRYTNLTPFTVHPSSPEFDKQLRKFAAICKIIKRMLRMRVGAIGARTTAFKSVRYDETALERHGIDVETFDLSTLFRKMRDYDENSDEVQKWIYDLNDVADFSNVPAGREVVMGNLQQRFQIS